MGVLLGLRVAVLNFGEVLHVVDGVNVDVLDLAEWDDEPWLLWVAVEADLVFVGDECPRVEEHEAFEQHLVAVLVLVDLRLVDDGLELRVFGGLHLQAVLFHLLHGNVL